MSDDVVEDGLISNVLEIAVKADDTGRHRLPTLARNLEAEYGTLPLLKKELVDRVLVARLIDEAPASGVYSPFQYLVRCYANVYRETRNVSATYRHRPRLMQRLHDVLVEVKELVLSYAGLVFTPGVIPHTEHESGLQILASIEANDCPKVGVEPMPSLFLDEFSAKHEADVVEQLLQPICMELQRRLHKMSLTGEFARPSQVLRALVNTSRVAQSIVNMTGFVDPHEDGFKLESQTLLGSVLSVGPFAHHPGSNRPDVGKEFFPDYENSSNRDIHQSVLSLRRVASQYGDDLHGLFRLLLKKETRSRTMEWLGHAIESNRARAQMHTNPLTISSNAFCFNLCMVLIKLCEPFVDPSGGKAWPHVTAEYVLLNDRLDFKEETRLAMNQTEADALQSSARQRGEGHVFHFICECFFMTLKALHLGIVKMITNLSNIARQIHNLESDVEELEAVVQAEQHPIRRAQAELQLKRYKTALERVHRDRLCMEAILCDEAMLTQLNAFYHLVMTWMTRLIRLDAAASFQIPLPDPVPEDFALLPEYALEDMVDVFIHTGHVAPQVMEGPALQETVIFFMALMGSPGYVKNPYLRTKLTEVLHACLPESLKHHPLMRRRSDILAFVFDRHPVILRHLVPCLLQLYVDIEFTGRHTQFYEKFHMRAYISEVLEYVWNIQEHNDAWKTVASKDGGRGLYLQFCNMLVNDSIFLLDESLKKLEEIKEIETLMADTAEWNRRTPEERQEREHDLRQHGLPFKDFLDSNFESLGAHLRSCFHQAKGCIRHLKRVTKETQRTFLLPEMVDRVASMLNYFLKYITGPERRKLKIKNPEEYDFDPKELLTGILEVYLHLESADTDGVFAVAVSSDGRSYRDAMFEEALIVVERMALMSPDHVDAVRILARKCKEASEKGAQEEEILGEIPDEFLDPIQCTLMRDPVILPTSGHTLDRATITRHLLSDRKDPFNREELTIEMLKPDTDLKAKIDFWLREQKSSS